MTAMRLSCCAVLALLTGCGDNSAGMGDPARKVECAIGSNASWNRNCAVEQEGDRLTLRHEDGGFRRFRLVTDGHGLASADGAEQARFEILASDRIELIVGDDRYRLPATVAEGSR